MVHPTLVDVVGEVVDHLEATALGVAVDAVEVAEVDVVDGAAIVGAVDQVDDGAADALDGGQPELHRTGGNVDGLCAQFERAAVGVLCVATRKAMPQALGPCSSAK